MDSSLRDSLNEVRRPSGTSGWHAPRSYNPAGAQEAFWPAYCEVNRCIAAAVGGPPHSKREMPLVSRGAL